MIEAGVGVVLWRPAAQVVHVNEQEGEHTERRRRHQEAVSGSGPFAPLRRLMLLIFLIYQFQVE